MKTLVAVLIRIQFLIIILIMFSGCGLKYTVKGKVVDAETGEPIEGAVYAVYWYTACEEYYEAACFGCCMLPFFGGSPLGPPACPGEWEDGITGADGKFKIIKYADTRSKMAVYKKGYVCWSQYTYYHPELLDEYKNGRIPYEKVRESRQEKFKIGSGMLIKLQPWKKEYSDATAIDHAKFCKTVGNGHYSSLFMKAISSEYLLIKKHER